MAVAPPEPSTAVVTARALTRRYGEGETAVHALRGVDLDIEAGRLTAVMGPSGSGKSTLMHLLAGLDRPDGGEVEIGGIKVTGLDDAGLTRLRREHIGFVFQFFNLLPMLTARENILLPLEIAGTQPDRGAGSTSWSPRSASATASATARASSPAASSSASPSRARSSAGRRVVFADEPTGNLDSTTSAEILALLRETVDSFGQTTVMVTHDPHAAAIADRVLFLDDGRIVRDLPAADAGTIIRTMEELRSA